jgi:NAD(P)-dependent dehydrogenase (short-subunit alcohol dehydrogenase family)
MLSHPRVWLITGASSGFGRAIAEAALDRGDSAVLAARSVDRLGPLTERRPDRALAVRLDVTDAGGRAAAVRAAVDRFGRIDVLVNNAGRGQAGAVEESTEADLRDLFEVHFFGPAALTAAVVPLMRQQAGGAVVQMSSSFGFAHAPGLSAYAATKFALEGFSGALAAEVAPFGIRVLLVEPGAFRTGILGQAFHSAPERPEYAQTAGATRRTLAELDGNQPGDPAKAAAAILAALDAEEPPLRLPLGDDGVDTVRDHLDRTVRDLDAWEKVGRATSFGG